MLTKLSISNFKSIPPKPKLDVALAPLTILVGPNGGGKSSITEALSVAVHVPEATDREGKVYIYPWPPPQGRLSVPAEELAFDRTKPTEITVEFSAPPGHPKFRGTAKWRYQSEPGGRAPRATPFETSSGLESLINAYRVRLATRAFLLASTRGAIPLEESNNQRPKVGQNGEYILSVLARIYGSQIYRRQAKEISAWAQRFGLPRLTAGVRLQNNVGADYVDPVSRNVIQLALASSGARQVLTLITQVVDVPDGSLILIEEPEISLHPQSQVQLADFLAEAVSGGKQLVVTTHSSFFLLALNRPIADGKLRAEQVAVYDVSKTPHGTVAKRLALSESGYITGWVPSFRGVEQKLMNDWAKQLPGPGNDAT